MSWETSFGGFAARAMALQKGHVLSEEPMAIFAANNIARAIDIYRSNGVCLAGLVVNLRSNEANVNLLHAFADRLNTKVITVVERDPRIQEAEKHQRTILSMSQMHLHRWRSRNWRSLLKLTHRKCHYRHL